MDRYLKVAAAPHKGRLANTLTIGLLAFALFAGVAQADEGIIISTLSSNHGSADLIYHASGGVYNVHSAKLPGASSDRPLF